MTFLAKIGVSIGLLFSSIFGLFNHIQTAVTLQPPVATSVSSQWVPISTVKNSDYYQTNGVISYGGSSPQYPGYPLVGADPTTFLVLVNASGTPIGLSKDINHVYVGNGILIGADPKTISPIEDSSREWNGFEKDQNNVYHGTDIISGADPQTFTSIGYVVYNEIEAGSYYKDKNFVYWLGIQIKAPVVVKRADPTSFALVTTSSNLYTKFQSTLDSCGQNCIYDAQDKNHKYLEGQVVQ